MFSIGKPLGLVFIQTPKAVNHVFIPIPKQIRGFYWMQNSKCDFMKLYPLQCNLCQVLHQHWRDCAYFCKWPFSYCAWINPSGWHTNHSTVSESGLNQVSTVISVMRKPYLHLSFCHEKTLFSSQHFSWVLTEPRPSIICKLLVWRDKWRKDMSHLCSSYILCSELRTRKYLWHQAKPCPVTS